MVAIRKGRGDFPAIAFDLNIWAGRKGSRIRLGHRGVKHALCDIAVYTNHINLGFNQGTELRDPTGLLKGTGAKIRHVPITAAAELQNPALVALVSEAVEHALVETGGSPLKVRRLVSKIS